MNENQADSADVIERILKRADRAAAIGAEDTHSHHEDDGDQLDLAERTSLRRVAGLSNCLLYTSPSPRDGLLSRMPSSA